MGLAIDAITGVILAGGMARRMGGQEKGLLQYQGKSLISHVITRLGPQLATLLINANRHHEEYARFGYPIFADREGNYLGPLAGVLAAFDHCHSDWILTVPTDAPHLSPQLVSRLASHVTTTKIYAVRCQHEWQPLFALWPRQIVPALESFLANGKRAVMDFLQEQHAIGVDFSDQLSTFSNINTPEDLLQVPQRCPVLGFVAWSGSGKTTLLKQLIPLLNAAGLRVGLIKHAHHQFDIDTPGKDSYELRKAGASQVMVASQQRWALMTETPQQQADPELMALLQHMDQNNLDIILVEGFKHTQYPKIEIHRPSQQQSLLSPQDPDIIAVASDAETLPKLTIPLLDLNNPQQIAGFIQRWLLDQTTTASA